MWCGRLSAGYTRRQGVRIELERLTNLPGEVVRQILQQQRAEEEYLNLLSGTASGQDEAAVQETTIAYLQDSGLDVDAYTSFLERQRRQKLEYISKHGFDDGYTEFIEELREQENRFLERIGMDFDKYNAFAKTYEPTYLGWSGSRSSGGGSGASARTAAVPRRDKATHPGRPILPAAANTDRTTERSGRRRVSPAIPNIPEELIPIFLQLLNS